MIRSRSLAALGMCLALVSACSSETSSGSNPTTAPKPSSSPATSTTTTAKTTTSEADEKAESTQALEETADTDVEESAVEETVGEDGIDYGVDAFDYEDVVDDTQSLSFSAPTVWTERRGEPIEQDGALWPRLAVSDDLEGFLTQPDMPGVIVTVYPGSDVMEAVENFAAEGLCATISDPEPAKSGPYSGQQLWGDDCDGGGGSFLAAVTNNDVLVTVYAQFQVATEREAALTALATLSYGS